MSLYKRNDYIKSNLILLEQMINNDTLNIPILKININQHKTNSNTYTTTSSTIYNDSITVSSICIPSDIFTISNNENTK